MRRRGISVLLVLGALAACGWLLWSELQASGVFEFDRGGTGRSETDAATLPLAELEADLRERFRLRGLPGIETAARGHGRLVGSVQLHGGGRGPLPLPGVTVQVIGLVKAPRASAGETGDVDATGNRSFARAAETGADGAFQLGDLPAGGAYTLVVRHVPYREIVLRGLNVQTGRTTDVGEILLGSPTSLQGEVVDAAGRPVGGARVQVFPDASRPERLDLRRGLTDLQGALDHLAESLAEADGSFRVQDLPPGRYLLRISAPGYAAVFREGVWVTADELSASVRVVLDAGAGYVGRVVDEEGRGIGGARVIAVAAPGTRIQRLDRVETTAASNGRYRLDRLVPGMRYFVEAWAEGYAPTGRFLVPEDLQELDLVLSPSGRVEGTITDAATGDGIGGAEVTLVAGMANTLSPVSTVTDDAGRYVLPYVSAGPIFLFAAKADGYPAGSFDASR
ncbi:MAG: MSCRAMM family protein, partial [Planctomycetota bacterium]